MQLRLELPEEPRRNNPTSGSFVNNMKLPIHRWFRYSAGFSAVWAESVIRSHSTSPDYSVYDPFAGSGTTLIASKSAGVKSFGVEAHPFIARIATTKCRWSVDTAHLNEAANELISASKSLLGGEPPLLLKRCYEASSADDLMRLKEAYFLLAGKTPPEIADLLHLAITSILRETSHSGTAQWQYLLPDRRKRRVTEVFEAIHNKIRQIIDDLEWAAPSAAIPAEIRRGDARHSLAPPADLIVTSPPYPNNFDYADATRLEMTFWGDVDRWADLHGAVRQDLIVSCSQHSAAEKLDARTVIEDPAVAAIKADLEIICDQLSIRRLEKPGKKTYDSMIAAYFVDLAKALSDMRKVLRHGGDAYLVIGDCAPYGVHVPVEKFLGELALANGFSSYRFDQLRARNVKWKNRKHEVPLKEGILFLEG